MTGVGWINGIKMDEANKTIEPISKFTTTAIMMFCFLNSTPHIKGGILLCYF
jgi:hypothetical protein